MFSEITISCFPQIPSFLQFSTPNKTFLSTQPAVSFHCYFLSAPILLSFPESSLCYCAHCLILQHRHLETSWHRQKSFERGWGKKAELPLQLARYSYEHSHCSFQKRVPRLTSFPLPLSSLPPRLLSMEISLHSDDTQMPSLTSSGGDKPIFSGPVALGFNNLTHSWAS